LTEPDFLWSIPPDMLICGLKLTHDGAVAILDDDRLLFSVEVEKLENRPRYSRLDDLALVTHVLSRFGLRSTDVGLFAIDGWGGSQLGAVPITIGEQRRFMPVARYHEREPDDDVLREYAGRTFPLSDQVCPYVSFSHAAGHALGAWYTSPFAARGEPAWVLVWDGGMLPRLYRVDPEKSVLACRGPLFPVVGSLYAIFASQFAPFRRPPEAAGDDSEIAGKVMAYVALGVPNERVIEIFTAVIGAGARKEPEHPTRLVPRLTRRLRGLGVSDVDVLASMQEYLRRLLVTSLPIASREPGSAPRNLCLVGGCALNIKWNTAIRASGAFGQVWVPPFANDSGSAIGVACAALFTRTKWRSLRWSVYAGAPLGPEEPGATWRRRPCDVASLARLLHEQEEPVVLLEGRAELGPRALGHRSIVASARRARMQHTLNEAKGREAYRPIAPVCLEDRAPHVFDPGSPDPYMMFEHQVRAAWRDRIPAVTHLDGTARLQTVADGDGRVLPHLLREYAKLSGVPVLCNTSANSKGCGFFPDLASAARWGRVRLLWAGGVLYEKMSKGPGDVPCVTG
jgi:carbamoyltransferase